MKVPFLDLKAQHRILADELQAAIQEVVDSAAFSGGPYVAAFENDFAAYCGSRFAVGVGSGTDALWLALLALGIGPGDEVVTVSSTFMATAEAISFCGARPVFVDVDEQTYTMDPALLETAITSRTKAIIPVHLFGQMADMDAILDVAKRHNLPVIEDACQAHGAEYIGRKAGTMGTMGCFSFYPGKNLGAFGEAGAVVTDHPELAGRLQVLRDHGQKRKYHHSAIGWNARMDGVQGAVLRTKLKHLDAWNAARQCHAHSYREHLKGIEEVILPTEAEYAAHVYHLFAVRVANRDDVIKALAECGVACGIHYPVPVHLQEAYQSLGHGRGSFPVTEACAHEFLSLPMFPELTPEQIAFVAQQLRTCVAANAEPIREAVA